MLSRPTTEQIILDCRHELLTTIDAAVDDPTVKVAIQMMENVLRNCAARAAHEIAWMRDETAAMVAFATDVAAAHPASTAVDAALAAYEAGRSESLHLDDVCATYDLAGRAMGAALEVVMAAGDDARHLTGRAILEERLAHENEIMGEWAFVGRA
ncbi:MAG: hypothetical protein MUE78_02855 [Ilumatobacteraceae bacterium]|jgi:hypothetical protein|nr:hypothetical protein [Ilumatobacteraceae bacterium]